MRLDYSSTVEWGTTPSSEPRIKWAFCRDLRFGSVRPVSDNIVKYRLYC